MKTSLDREACVKAPTQELIRHIDEVLDRRHGLDPVVEEAPVAAAGSPAMPLSILRTLMRGIGGSRN